MNEILNEIESSRVIAILRGVSAEKMECLFQALYEGGVRLAEITLNSEGALHCIERMRATFESRIIVGAGTVLNMKMARDAIAAGAQFLISPNVDQGMIETANRLGALPIPGALTPTEIVQATHYGAPIIKLFPCGSFGANYLKEIKAPLDDTKIIAVGGINKENARSFLQAGASGIGVGGGLIDKQAIERGDYPFIVKEALRLKEAISG